MEPRNRLWKLLAIMVAAAMFSAACGDDSDAGDGGASTDDQADDGPVENDESDADSDAGTDDESDEGSADDEAEEPAPTVEGVSEDSIKVSVVAGFSGLFGEVIQGIYVSGMETWAEEVNANGGIHGRTVELVQVDHKETPDGGVAACQEVLSNGSFTAVLVQGTEAQAAAADCLDDAGFTNMVWTAADSFVESWTSSYTIFPSEEQQGVLLAQFLAAESPDAVVGVIELTIPVYTRIGDAFVAEAQAQGLEVVDTLAVEFGQASFTPQVLRLQEAGATTVAMFVTNEAIQIATDAGQLGYTPAYTGALFEFDFVTQAAPGLLDGAAGLRLNATIDTPEYAAFQALAQKHGRSGALDGEAFLYFGYGLLLEAVLDAAGDTPTPDSLVAAIESLDGFETGVLPPITWGSGDLVGSTSMFPTVCCSPDNTWAADGDPVRLG